MTVQLNLIPEEARRRAHELLSRLRVSPELMAELIEHTTSATFPKGESIFVQGSTSNVGYWILSGLVKVFFPLADGTRVIAKIAGPGEFVGAIDCMGAGGRRGQAFEAQAMTRATVAIFTRDHVLAMLKTMSPASLVTLLEDVNTTWSEVFSSCAKFLGLSFRDRLQWVFHYLAERYGVRDTRGILLTLELSHEDLAEMIASSRPMVSRLIAEFVKQGELAHQGKHYILVKRAASSIQPVPPASKASAPVSRERVVTRLEPVVKQARM